MRALPFAAAFAPSPQSGRQIDTAVRHELAASIDAIASALDGALAIDRDAIAALTKAIRAHPVRPAIMGLYASLVPALLQDETRAQSLLSMLAEPQWRAPATFQIVTLDDRNLGDGNTAIYLEHVNDDPAVQLLLQPLTNAALRGARQRVGDALALLDRANPGLSGEIQALISQVLLVRHQAKLGEYALNGTSSFHLWGALTLNIEASPDRISLLQGLVHEAAHSLLHGLTMGKAAVSNDPAELYPSPLREDPRPMEGLVHATFVLARMHFALESVLRLDSLDASERKMAERDIHDIREAYADGLRTVRSAARFTTNGAAAFAQAQDYMARAAGLGLSVTAA